MNGEKWTEAMQEAFGRAAQNALALNQQIVDVEHLMYALLEDSSGIFYRVLTKLNISIPEVQDLLNAEINKKPSVGQVTQDQLRLSYDLNSWIANAERIKTEYKDDYMSVEHLIIALFNTQSTFIKNFVSRYNLNKKEVEKQLGDLDDYYALKTKTSKGFIVIKKNGLTKDFVSSEGKVTNLLGVEDITTILE